MAWVVDTALLIDVLEHDAKFGVASARVMDARSADGLVLCPISYVELAPAFEGNIGFQEAFLDGIGVNYQQEWTADDTRRAHAAWNLYVQRRRTRHVPKRPLADLLIGAFASRFQGLMTRNEADFRRVFPSLRLASP